VDNEDRNNFVNLNRDNRWPDFEWQGLELREDGALQLHSLPLLGGILAEEVASARDPYGPAGIAVDRDGTVFFSDPACDLVMKLDPCDGSIAPVACMGGEGCAPTEFKEPRGLVIPPHRHSLFVADSGNNRIQVFDIATSQLVDVWEETGVAGSESKLDAPSSLAADGDGNVYVVDYGNRRVVKFNRAGTGEPAFWETIKDTNLLRKPSDIAVYWHGSRSRVFILDEELRSVFVFDENGHSVLSCGFGETELHKPMGIVATRDAVYVGDNERRRVFVFARGGDYRFIGEAVGYRGPVASLARNNDGDILVHTGVSIAAEPVCRFGQVVTPLVPLAPVRLIVGKGYSERGMLWTKHPIEIRDFEAKWHRLKADVQRSVNARLRLFVHASSDSSDPPLVDPQKLDPFEDVKWQPRSGAIDQFANVDDLFIGEETRFLWIGALFSGDGLSTTVLSQMRVEFDQLTYLDHLPAIYRGKTSCDDFLLRFLSLFETFFAQVEGEVETLSELFDPAAAPQQYLPWLAGWLGLQLDQDWTEDEQRRAIRAAFESYGRRGTPEGLREALHTLARVDAVIEEPIQNASWWSLPAVAESCECKKNNQTQPGWPGGETSILGATTMLVPVHPQGAVLGSSATLDGSNIITNEQFGVPLFEDTAHQFSVQVYRGQLQCPEDISNVRAVIAREKPAHTSYHLCVIEPRMRVGFQARVGIDAIVAGAAEAMTLSDEIALGEQTALGGESAGQLGFDIRVGVTTRLG
jgi:phage tail-like protein